MDTYYLGSDCTDRSYRSSFFDMANLVLKTLGHYPAPGRVLIWT